MRFASLLSAGLLLSLPLLLCAAPENEVDGERALSTVKTLADDSFGGRKSGLASGRNAEEWMAGRVREFGLRPGNGESFFHELTATVTEELPTPALTVTLTVNFDVAADVESVDQILNRADATDEDDNTGNDTDPVEIDEVAELVVDKEFTADIVNAGTSSSFTIKVTNNGPSDSDDVLISDIVDGRLDVTSVTAVGDPTDDGADADADTNDQTITWLVPTLGVGESVTLTVNFDVAADETEATINNLAVALDEDDNTGQDIDPVEILIEIELSIVKTF